MTTRPYDLVIRNGTLVAGGTQFEAHVAVRDGRLEGFYGDTDPLPAEREIDATGLHVLPGIIDPHVHTRFPGVDERETFASGTAAAAAGGITTIFEMPISTVSTNSAASFQVRADLMAPQAHIDFALYGGAGRDNIETIVEQADAGAIAFKTFLQPPPDGREEEFRGLWCRHDEVRAVMDVVRLTGLRHCFHCEEPGMYGPLRAFLEARGDTRGSAHAAARPEACENASVAVVIAKARERPLPIGIVHCSSVTSARLASDARRHGLNITAEACVPYLFHTSDALDRLGPYAKCNPPLRSADTRDGLWRGIGSGLIEYLGTDHSPFTRADKERHGEDIHKAPPGIAALDIYVPLLLTGVHERRMSLPQMVAVCAENPAYVFRLPHKGRLVKGVDGDFTIVDLKKRWRFNPRKARTHARDNMRIWEGFAFTGAVHATIVRGVPVYLEGDIVGAPGFGRLQRPDRNAEGGRPIEGALWGAAPHS